MPSYFVTLPGIQYPSRDFTLIVSSFVFLCIHHPLSSPVIAHFNQQFIPQYISRRQLAPAFFQPSGLILFFTLSPSPSPSADQPVTSVPVAIYFLGPFCSPKHLFKYIISGILLYLYILPLSFLSGIPLIVTLPSAVVSYNHPLPSLTGIVTTHLVTCLSLHQSQNCTCPF